MATTADKIISLDSKPSTAEGRLRVLHAVIGAISIGLVFCWLQFSTPSICCGDFDGYYHIKWSQLLWNGLRSGHFSPRFIWLPLTSLNASHYADQHFLYHLLLVPFTWFGDLRLAAKVATTLFGSISIFSLYWLILRYRIRYALLWLMALLGCSWLFYLRLNMTKAQSISILFMVAGIVLLFERKYVWLAPAAFLYVWTYNLFVMLGVLAIIWVAVLWWSERRIEWRALSWTGLGMLAGFIVNPYFPHDVSLFLAHVAAKSAQSSMPAGVGDEWYAMPSGQFLDASLIASISMVVGYIAFGYVLSSSHEDRTRVQRPLAFLLFSSFLFVIAVRSNRFMEYWPPFAVLFAAFALHAVWHNPPWVRSSPQAGTDLPVPADVDEAGKSEHSWTAAYIIPIVVLLGATLFYNLHTTRAKIVENTRGPDHYRAGTEWMLANIPPGTLIYEVNWSDFPKLFFYDTIHTYVSGLDPIYLEAQHPEVVRLNERLSDGEEEHPADALRSFFATINQARAGYLFIGDYPAPPSGEWFRYLKKSGGFEKVYGDNECLILHVVDSALSTGAAANPGGMTDVPVSRAGEK
jgi:hypothetical protein